MADNDPSVLPPPSAEQRRVAAGQFERANQVIAKGDHDYGIRLLLSCCRLDPANLTFRQTLRRTEKNKYKNNLRGGWLSWLFTWPTKARIKAAKRNNDWVKVLEHGEMVLIRNPWDTGVQLDMARAAEELGLLDIAIWSADQARQKNPMDARVNRTLAHLLEKRGNFTQAMALWNLVLQLNPQDEEAEQKTKDLAIHDTIAKGKYEEALAGGTLARPGQPESDSAAERDGKQASLTDRVAKEAAVIQTKITGDPTNPNGYLQLAALYRRSELFDRARTTLRDALAATAQNFDVACELQDLEIDEFRRNLKITEHKLREQPASKDLKKMCVQMEKEINTRELELFRTKADRFPANMAFRFELGVRLLRAGQIDEAIRELQATRADPRHQWRSLYHLGFCFKNRNNWRLSRRNFEESLQNLPSGEDAARKEILFQLADGCAGAGDLPQAIEFGTELGNLDFNFRDIGRLLDEWQTRMQES